MKINHFWKPILWLIIILTMSLIPGNKLPGLPLFPHLDTVVHAPMYFGLAVLLIRPLTTNKIPRYYLLTMLICIVVGTILELSQEYFAVKRLGSWLDELANISGTLLGISFYHYAIRGYRWERMF